MWSSLHDADMNGCNGEYSKKFYKLIKLFFKGITCCWYSCNGPGPYASCSGLMNTAKEVAL